MDIFLSINNREEVIRFPIIPSSFNIQSGSNLNTVKSINNEEIIFIGQKKLKTVSWESFFPTMDYEFNRNRNLSGFEFCENIEQFMQRKLPTRLIITDDSKTILNIATVLESFDYGMKDGTKDVFYKIKLKEFNLLEGN